MSHIQPSFFGPHPPATPGLVISLSDGENAAVAGNVVGFDAILADARRRFVCAECGAEFLGHQGRSSLTLIRLAAWVLSPKHPAFAHMASLTVLPIG